MNKNIEKFDFVIIGAGIVGLTIAHSLLSEQPHSRILILEKETSIGLHSSGRNSGVLHSGIYYPYGSLKAKVCRQGAKKMSQYCKRHQLPIHKTGKVIVPFQEQQNKQLQDLYQCARKNNANVELINQTQLTEIEPEAFSATGQAIYSPDTSVVDPLSVLRNLVKHLKKAGVIFRFESEITSASVKPESSQITLGSVIYQYNSLYNAAGLFADKIAKYFHVAEQYTMIPFKGKYFKQSPISTLKFHGLIYPVPDKNVPFLGIHTVKTYDGTVYFGPSALPAFGRENYSGIKGIEPINGTHILLQLMKQYHLNNNNFRNYAYQEIKTLTKQGFFGAIKKLIPNITPADFIATSKVGIRPQLLNTTNNQLEMDFIIKRKENTIHILNAVSPAFTSAFEFSSLVVKNII